MSRIAVVNQAGEVLNVIVAGEGWETPNGHRAVEHDEASVGGRFDGRTHTPTAASDPELAAAPAAPEGPSIEDRLEAVEETLRRAAGQQVAGDARTLADALRPDRD